jgi:prepilin-type N-terminal cleavage/methylation domain-containing protein
MVDLPERPPNSQSPVQKSTIISRQSKPLRRLQSQIIREILKIRDFFSSTMKTPSRRHSAAFTLIELMAVIVIIVILAGIVVGSMGFVNEKQARSKAKVQIDLLSKAIEDYKMDNGTYPPTTNKSSVSGANGTATSSILFDYLYFDSDRDGAGVPGDTDQKIYLSELDPANNKMGWTTGTAGKNTIITDPWGNQYCYRTATGTPNAQGVTPTNTATQNPDFDLWSMGKDGASDSAPEMSKPKNKDDIRNF